VLQHYRHDLTSWDSVRTQEANMLVQYGMSLKGDDIAPEKAISFLSTFVESGQDNIEAARKIDEEIITIDREIQRLLDQTSEKKGDTDGDVAIVLHAKNASTVELRLTYRKPSYTINRIPIILTISLVVDGAIWKAAYDLHATTEEGQPSSSVELHFRARVSQVTGEDWSATALTLSTAAFDPLGQTLPASKPLRVTPIHNQMKTSLFGPNNANRNLFGPNVAQSIPIQSAPVFGSSSFGQGRQQQQQQPALPGAPVQVPIPSAFGAFGSTTTQSASTGGSLFGSSQVQPPQPQAALAAPAPPLPTVEDRVPELGTGALGEIDAFSVSEFTDLSLEEGTGSKPKTVVSESPFSTTYKVEGKSTIPSDGVDHQVLVAVLPFEAKLSYVAVPRAQTVAYMQVREDVHSAL
jgi:hypothetical protein